MNKSELLPLIRENGTFSETRSLLAEVYDKEIAHIQSLVDRRSYPFIRSKSRHYPSPPPPTLSFHLRCRGGEGGKRKGQGNPFL